MVLEGSASVVVTWGLGLCVMCWMWARAERSFKNAVNVWKTACLTTWWIIAAATGAAWLTGFSYDGDCIPDPLPSECSVIVVRDVSGEERIRTWLFLVVFLGVPAAIPGRGVRNRLRRGLGQ